MAFLLKKGLWESHIPVWLRRGFLILVCAGLLLFLAVEGCILRRFTQKGPAELDYLIVLGAQMKTGGPSKALQYRLDEACRYLDENPGIKVIVSGGQGTDEPVSEAQGMYDYLVGKGIDKERIIMEDKSTDTSENIAFSSVFLDVENDHVGIVTNNFHVFRGVHLAKHQGIQNVCGIAAPSNVYFQLNNMVRDFFGIIKDLVCGNLI